MARTDNVFETRLGTYIESVNPLGLDILVKGTSKYINFNTINGSTGYGFRDNSGVMEAKNSGGAWSPIFTGAGGTISGDLLITGTLTVNGATILQSTTTVAGVAKFADGAVATPSIAFTTDPTTGFYHTGTGATGVILGAINGVQRLALSATGLGIGTTDTSYTVHVRATTPDFRLSSSAETDALTQNITFGTPTYNRALIRATNVGTTGGSTMSFWTAASGASVSQRMTILSTGLVGIGTTAPQHPLQVYGPIKSGGNAGQTYGDVVLGDDASTAMNVGMFRGTAAGARGGGNVLLLAGYSGVGITSAAAAFGSQGAPRLYVANDTGNVGIGTTTNPSRLSIQGTGSYNSTVWGQASDLSIRSSEMTDGLAHSILQLVAIRQSLSTGSASVSYLGFTSIDDSNNSGVSDAARIQLHNEATSDLTSATALSFWTNAGGSYAGAATEKMRITSGGNVGIGTTTFGASAAKTLALTNTATAPSDSANLAHLYSADAAGAGTASLAIWQEYAPYAGVAVASTTKIPIMVNGTCYYLLASTVA